LSNKVIDATQALIDRLLLERISLAGIARAVQVATVDIHSDAAYRHCLNPVNRPRLNEVELLLMDITRRTLSSLVWN
jgi:hypothetical protein